MVIKAVLFDFDQTLVNLGKYVDWSTARKEMAEVYADKGVPTSLVDRYADSTDLFAAMFDELPSLFSSDKISFVQLEVSKVLDKYELKALNHIALMDECAEILKWLKERDIKIGIISLNGKNVIEKALGKADIHKYIDAFFSRDSLGKAKPHVDQVWMCLKKFECSKTESIMVGDEIIDVRTAKNAGVFFVGLTSDRFAEEKLKSQGADKTIKRLSELRKLISDLQNC